ncbi:MAG TPA: hypothetical protein VNQ90_06920 [Chthoniobacteraceae bacterium]|nr:hypothetical protein [Chthoniobacteraceae bacterium]
MTTTSLRCFSLFAFLCCGWAGAPLSAKAAIVIHAAETDLSAVADPKGIAGDGAYETTTPAWQINPNDQSVQVAVDSANESDPQFRARGVVQFGLPALADGEYHLSMFVKTVNIARSNTDTARDQSFAVRLVALGDAQFNGVAGGSSGWIVVKPLYNDTTKGGAAPPFHDLHLAGDEGENSSWFEISGAWDTTASFTLQGADGVNGSFRIEVLDGTGVNYGSLFVDNFTFVAIPEPQAPLAFLAGGLGLVLLVRHQKSRRKAA